MTVSVGLVGKGALGLLFGDIAQRSLGADNVCFLMDEERALRHRNDVYLINGSEVRFHDCTPETAREVDLVLLGVKSTGLQDAIELMEPFVGPETVIVPLLNGITSEEKVAARYGWDHVVACVSYGMDAARYGTSLEYSRVGELQIGAIGETPCATVNRAHELLVVAGIPHTVHDDMSRMLWTKYLANVGVNQTCAVFQVNYGELFSDPTSEAFRTYIGAMREVIAVAHAEGVELTEADMNGYINVLHTLDPNSRPSTAQDRVNHNPSEVEEFSGEVIRRAEKHGIYVPCNQFYYDRIREYESNY